jgi:hypothetical protein
LGHAASVSLYDYASGDPVNAFDADGRYGKGVAAGWSGNIGSGSPSSSAFSAGLMSGGSASGVASGFGRGAANIGIGVMDTAVGFAQTGWAFTGGAVVNATQGQQTIYGALGSTAYSLATSSSARTAAWNGVSSYAYETFTDTDKFSQRVGGGSAVTLATLGASRIAEGLRATRALATAADVLQAPHSGLLKVLSQGADVPVPVGTTGIRPMMADITLNTGNEVGLLRLGDGSRVFRMGGPDYVSLGSDVERVIAHTHPSGILEFSDADLMALLRRGQRSSVLIDPTSAVGVRSSVSGKW